MMEADLPQVGAKATLERAFTSEDIRAFASVSGDINPVHLDDDAARRMGFNGVIVHGILAASLISRLLGNELPGPGTIYLAQSLRFQRPIGAGEKVSASVQVASRREDKPIFELDTIVRVGNEIAIEGKATVLVKRP